MATFQDPTVSHLERLAHDTAHQAHQMVVAVRITGVPLFISSSVRSSQVQAQLVRAGRSQTFRSRHLTGEAFDVDVLGFGRDEIPLWWFYNLGAFGEHLGLRWGGRWTIPRDFGHFESMRSLR